MDLIKKLADLILYYREDESKGIPYWQDKTLWGLVIGILAALYARFTGVVVSNDVQLALVTAGAGIGNMLSSRTGIKKVSAPRKEPDLPNIM